MAEQGKTRTVAVVGGGAGGLCAAIAAADAGANVKVTESYDRVGTKLLKTGNGRCNLTNLGVAPAAYNRPDFTAPLLERCGCDEILAFFSSLGLLTYADDEGRVYPRSGTAASVLDVLRLAAGEREIEFKCSCEAASAAKDGGGFRVSLRDGGTVRADRLIVAAGGGTSLAAALGHKTVPFEPVLCPLKTDTAPIRGLSGLRVRARVRLERRGRVVHEETGEILFRDFGLSGIPALDLSRYIEKGDILALDLLPDLTDEELRALLERMLALRGGGEDVFTGVFHRRVGEAVLRAAGSREPEALLRAIRGLRMRVEGPGDVKNAQVTRGGAVCAAFDPLTLESRLCPGLYEIGEALDIDGRCGGFNLHWAFSSGLAAGRSAGA